MSVEVIYDTFQAKWGVPPSFRGLGQFRAEVSADNTHIMGPLSQGEIQASLQRASNDSAPGPDGIGKRDILNWVPVQHVVVHRNHSYPSEEKSNSANS